MSVKSPVSDEVFEKFIQKTSTDKLEKKFGVKGVKFEKSNISTAESVTKVDKSAVFFFNSEFSPEKAARVYDEVKVDLKKLESTKFYEFSKNVNSLDWKGEETVPMFNSISGVNCEKCGGKGYKSCEKCDGTGVIKCKKCGGSAQVECKECKGSGKLSIEIEVINGNTDKKTKKPYTYQCPKCLGSGKLGCSECGAVGKSSCDKCKPNLGKIFCNECKGIGKNYKYKKESIPYTVPKQQYVPHLFFKPETEKQIGEELSPVLNTVDGIYIKNLDDMDEKFVKAQLGFWDNDIKSRMNNAKNLFKELKKKKGPESPKFPIYLFPVLHLIAQTAKGKKFDIFSIGTEKGYDVFVPKF